MDSIYIEKVLNGDIDAFQYFVHQYKNMAYNVAVSILKNEFDAKDAIQEAFVIAFRKLNSFKGKSKFSTWLCRIVINEAFKQAKGKTREPVKYQEVPDVQNEKLEQAFELIKEDQQKYFIDLALQNLSSKEALALNLYYLEEYSVEEVSDLTGWSAANVKVILFRARRNMYNELSRILKKEIKILY